MRLIHRRMIVGMSVLFAALFLTGCATDPVFFSDKAVPGLEMVRSSLPVFILPQADIDAGNGIQAVFYHRKDRMDGYNLEVTVVFWDEDHPQPGMDSLYDSFRAGSKYRRIADVETFVLKYRGGQLQEVDFDNVYSGSQVFFEKDVKHFSAVVSGDEFDRDLSTGRVKIYINTWNHMFAENNTNPGMTGLESIGDYPIYIGDRPAVESFYQNR